MDQKNKRIKTNTGDSTMDEKELLLSEEEIEKMVIEFLLTKTNGQWHKETLKPHSLKEHGVDLFKMFASKSFSYYGPVYDDEEQSFIVKFCVELNEDDVQHIIDLLRKHYQHVEDQKYKVIRRSLRIERFASDHLFVTR